MSEQSSGKLSFSERFQIVSNVGSGCYGDVFKAYDTVLHRTVALKRIRKFDNKVGLPTAFYRELTTLEQISHPNVTKLFETIRNESDELFLEMEYCEYDLQALIAKRLTPSQCLSYFSQICHGIAELHINNIFHRDLKPANILVNSNNEVKVTDFGLSRTIAPPNSRYTPHVGSGCYRAPEIIAGNGQYDFAVDIWALGCILFEMVSKNSKRFLLGGKNVMQELEQMASIYGIEELSKYPPFAQFFASNRISSAGSLSSYLRKNVPARNAWSIPLLEQMLQIDPKKRPDIAQILNSLNYLSVLEASKLPELDLAEMHGYNIGQFIAAQGSSRRYAISPPRVSPIMIPIDA